MIGDPSPRACAEPPAEAGISSSRVGSRGHLLCDGNPATQRSVSGFQFTKSDSTSSIDWCHHDGAIANGAGFLARGRFCPPAALLQ